MGHGTLLSLIRFNDINRTDPDHGNYDKYLCAGLKAYES